MEGLALEQIGHSLTLEQKVKVILENQKGISQRTLAYRFNCGKTQIQTIISRKDYYLKLWKEKNRNQPVILPKNSSPGIHTNSKLDNMLLEHLTECQKKNITFTAPMLQDTATLFAENLKILNFKASQAWADSFIKHYSLNIPLSLQFKYSTEDADDKNASSVRKSKFMKTSLSLAQRLLIIKKNESGVSQRLLAKQFDCSKSLIQTIVANKKRYELEWEESRKGKTKSSSEDSASITKEDCNGTDAHHPIIVSILRNKDSSGESQYKVSNSSSLHGQEQQKKSPCVSTDLQTFKTVPSSGLVGKDTQLHRNTGAKQSGVQQNSSGSHSNILQSELLKPGSMSLYNMYYNRSSDNSKQEVSWPLLKSKPLNFAEGRHSVLNEHLSNTNEQTDDEESDDSDFIEIRHSTLLNYVYATQYLNL